MVNCTFGGTTVPQAVGACKLSNGQPGTCGVNYTSYTVDCCTYISGVKTTCEDTSFQAFCLYPSASKNEGKPCFLKSGAGGQGKCESPSGECK